MLLTIALTEFLLFFKPELAHFYIVYVIMFDMPVGPVFSSGSITQERERRTLRLLLTTLLGPWRIALAKLVAALRITTVLTFVLTEQLFLAYALIPELRERFPTLVRLSGDHRGDLPGDDDCRTALLGVVETNVNGDGLDLHDAARLVCLTARGETVPA